MLDDHSLHDPGLPPYLPREYINDIKDAIQDGFSVASMSAKEWYTYLLNKYILEEKQKMTPLCGRQRPLEQRFSIPWWTGNIPGSLLEFKESPMSVALFCSVCCINFFLQDLASTGSLLGRIHRHFVFCGGWPSGRWHASCLPTMWAFISSYGLADCHSKNVWS